MSLGMELAYAPDRVRVLSGRVRHCIDELLRCNSTDPAAAGAMRVLRLTRRNLEDQWMPLLTRIEQSTVMTSWTSSALTGLQPSPAARRIIELLYRRPWLDDVDAMVQAGKIAIELDRLLTDPQACLDVLSDRTALFMLAEWELLPDDVVEGVVVAGLHRAVLEAPGRLGEGHEVLRQLTAFANGPLDDGFRPGMSRGVATAMSAYITTIAPGITQMGDSPVFAIDEAAGVDVEIGSYDEVADLFGALLRDERAQATIGTVLGGYTRSVIRDLGPHLADYAGLEHVAGITLLLADAAVAEQSELVAHAAEQAAVRRAVGDAIGFAVKNGLSATGAGAVVAVAAGQSIAMATDLLARVDAQQLPGASLPTTVYDIITVETLTMLVEEPATRRGAGMASVTRQHWNEVGRRLALIDSAATPSERKHRTARLERWLDAEVPALAGYVTTVRARADLPSIAQPRPEGDPDED